MSADYPNPQIRLYSPEDLALAESGDPWMGTLILNKSTFSPVELRTYYKIRERHYLASFDTGGAESFEAIDDPSAIRFANCQWHGVSMIEEVVILPRTYREVDMGAAQ